MDILFLEEREGGQSDPETAGDAERVLTELQEVLQQVRHALRDVLLSSRSNRKEAQQWLVNALAGLELQDPGTKRQRWAQFLPGGAACRGAEHRALAQAMLQLLFESAPAEVGALVAHDALLLRHFFRSDPQRAPLWFGHFSMEGMRGFKYGAAALAQYALTRRAEMWHLLAWQGRHAQAPVAVVQRPHYFSELDVPRTVRHLVRDCPDFWSSPELRQSVQDGAAQLLALDPAFWSKELLRWLEDQRSAAGGRLHALLCRCLEEGPWRQYCQRLLHLLPQRDLLPFAADALGGSSFQAGVHSSAAPAQAGAPPGAWLVFRGVRWQSLDELLLAATLGFCPALLLRLLGDDEWMDERQKVERLVQRLLLPEGPDRAPAASASAHWRLRHRLARQGSNGAAVHEMLLLHLFAAALLVRQLAGSTNSADAAQLQQLLTASGLSCQLAQQRHGAGGERRRGSSQKHKKRRRRRSRSTDRGSSRKKRRRSRSCSRSNNDSDSSGAEGHGGEVDLDLLPAGAEWEEPGQLWQLQRPGSGSSAVPASSLELLDVVIDATAAAHARWLCACSPAAHA